MKKIFRKAITVLGSVALVGATMGAAVAASLDDYQSNSAIVVGANADQSDGDAAADVKTALDAMSDGGSALVGGESFLLDKSSTHMNFGDALNKVYSSLDEDQLGFLADGNYDDGDVDVDYTQEITLGSLNMSQYADKDFKNDAPSVGWMFEKDDLILNYTINFDESVNATEMAETDMPLLGNEYYVISADYNTITLLDSAESTILADGETVTISGKEVSIAFISDNGVKLTIDGETTDQLTAGETEELKDGSYVSVTELLTSNRETTVQKVELSIGTGKIILESGDEVIIGEDSNDDIDGLVVTIDGTTPDLIDSITLSWSAYEDTFLAEGSPITMPGFELIGLEFDGLNLPTDSEMIEIESGETLTLKMGNFDLPVVTWNDTDVLQGEEDYPLVIATATTTYAAAGYANDTTPFFETSAITNTSTLSSGLVLQEDSRFIVTSLDDDLSDIETLYYEVKEITVDDDGTFDVVLDDLIGDADLIFDENNYDDEAYDTTVTIDGFNSANNTVYLSFDAPGTEKYNLAVSDTGLVVRLPTLNSTGFGFTEANDDDDINGGESFNATVLVSSNDKVYVSYSGTSNEQEESDDNYVDIISSKLASVIKTDESGDEYDFEIEYFGNEVTSDVSVVAGGEEGESSEAGVQVYTDAESSAFAGMDLIVVGGSAINSVAAELLDDSYSEAAFTAETGVAAGQFLIETFNRDSGEMATLVAGYNAEDTEMGVEYFLNEDVDTTVGKKYKGTSATEATVVTA